MANFWLKPHDDRPTSTAGGVGSGTDIIAASIDSMLKVDNSTAAMDGLTEGYEEWRRRFKAGTGQDAPANPMMAPAASLVPNPLTIFAGAPMAGEIVDRQRTAFAQFINEQAARFPAEAVRDWAQFDPGQYAEQEARAADANLARLMESRQGWDKYIAAFTGAAIGGMRDPVQLGSLALGGGPGGARTVLGRILMTAGTEAGVNAATEAVLQPQVQAWRAQAGLDSGLDVALTNIAFAGLLGGVFGAGGSGLAEVLQRLPAGAAARAAMPADLRGAIDAGDMIAMSQAQRPEGISAAALDRALVRSDMAVQQPDLPPLPMVLDELQVNRIVDALAPAGEPRLTDMSGTLDLIRTGDVGDTLSARPVLRFVASIGGVDPKSPIAAELQAAGITSRHMPGMFKSGGRQNLDNIPMDEARGAFASRADIDDGNGYVSQQAFIDAMTTEVERRGEAMGAATEAQAHYERRGVDFAADDETILQRLAEVDAVDSRYHAQGVAARAETTDLVRQALELGGGTLPDAVVRAAVDLHRMEGESLPTAVEWAMSDAAGVSRTTPAEPALEAPDLDGWGDEFADEGNWAAELEEIRELDPTLAKELDKTFGADIKRASSAQSVVNDCPF